MSDYYKKTHLLLLTCAIAAAAAAPVTARAAQGTYQARVAPQPNDLQFIFEAVDRGDINSLAAYLNFVRTYPELNIHLISNGRPNLNFTDQDGNTPLIRAARQNNLDMVRFLLSTGVNINAVNNRNESALITSYTFQQYHISRYLLAVGASDPYYIAQLLQNTPVAQPPADRAVTAAAPPPPAQEVAQNNAMKAPAENPGELSPSAGPLAAAPLAFGISQPSLYLIGGAVAAAAGTGGAVLAGGSAGGKTPALAVLSAPPPKNGSPLFFHTDEAENQEGIYGMRAEYALARGYDGSIYDRAAGGALNSTTPIGSVRVAVVDTGIKLDHPDLVNNILLADSVTCNDLGCVAGGSDTEGHGTTVAGIIAASLNGIGMHGVAPKAKIMSIGFADAVGNLTSGDAPGIESALDSGAQVINGSYGFIGLHAPDADAAGIAAIQSILNTDYGGTDLMTQFQRGVTDNAIFVFAAGNESTASTPVLHPTVPASLPYFFRGAAVPPGVNAADYAAVNPSGYDWSKNWVAAVSVYQDSSNNFQISEFSNQCGEAKEWCIAAPGEISKSTSFAGGYTGPIQGTSFAAPNIAGAIAAMLGAFPHLTPEKVLLALFDTATDLGAPGVDDVFGHGLVNLDRATDPSDGDWQIATAAITISRPFTSSGLGLSAPFGNALSSNRATLMFLDRYTKNYYVPLSALTGSLTPARTDYDRLARLGRPQMDKAMLLGENTTLHFATAASSGYGEDAKTDTMSRFSYASGIPLDAEGSRMASFAFNYKTSLAELLAPEEQRMIASDALKNPYLALLDTSNSSIVGYADGNTSVTTAAYAGKHSHAEYAYQFDESRKTTGVYSEVAYARGASSVSLNNGIIAENSTILGSETGGAFVVDKATTYHSGVAAKYVFDDSAALLANAHIGYTDVAAASDSILSGFSGIITSSFAAGGELYDTLYDDDTLGLVVSQPLRVMRGSANLTLPMGISGDGSILSQRSFLNLAPTGREVDFEMFYNLRQSESSELSVNGMYRLNADHDPSRNDALFLAKYKIRM